MKFYGLFSILATLQNGITGAQQECDVNIYGFRYRKEIVTSDFDTVTKMKIDSKTNFLYFNYFDMEEYNEKSVRYNLDTNEYSIIKELIGFCSFATDPQLEDIYAGCKGEFHGSGKEGGLFKYDRNMDRFVLIAEKDKFIYNIYYNENLYYTVISANQLNEVFYQIVSGRSTRVEDSQKVSFIVIDKDGDKIFTNRSGLFRKKVESLDTVFYSTPKRFKPASLAVDAYGDTYVCDNVSKGIFLINRNNATLSKIVDAKQCLSIVFDKENNLIYSSWVSPNIVRFRKCI